MQDPREMVDEDIYEVITSDGEEKDGIEAEIEEIDRRKEDLLRRLNAKKSNSKPPDPNFNYVEVRSTPRKFYKDISSTMHQQKEPENEVRNENPNELKAQAVEKIPGNTTSFFIERYSNCKRKQDSEIRAYEELLRRRVHMFEGLEKEEYEPISTNELEEYSNLWINKRYIPKEKERSIFSNVKILRLNKLFAKVRPPEFNEPHYSNWAVIGLISNKDKVKFTSAASPKKYFRFTLTNFQYNIDTYVFGKEGVERYYNLCIGDVVAILNPQILPWRPPSDRSHIRSFNLRISHKFNCILEIGSSRDLGWCPILNKSRNGTCGSPINKDKENCCEYHREVQLRDTNAKRVELSGTYALGAPTNTDRQPALYRGSISRQKPVYNVVANGGTDYLPKKRSNTSASGAQHFSDRNAARAFFNERFKNTRNSEKPDSKRKTKSRILYHELKKTSEIDIGHKSAAELDVLKRTTESTLNSGIIKNLGFDPTHGKMANVLKQSKTRSDKEPMSEKDSTVAALLNFKKNNIQLNPSKDILIKQKKRRERVWKEHFGSDDNEPDDSGSDLEIVT